MDPVLITQKIIILNSEGKILSIRRSKTDNAAFAWDLPGGLIDKGENLVDAILREVKEEVYIEISKPEILDVFASTSAVNGYFVCIGYKAQALSADVKLSWEHDQYEWLTKEEFLEREAKNRIKELVGKL